MGRPAPQTSRRSVGGSLAAVRRRGFRLREKRRSGGRGTFPRGGSRRIVRTVFTRKWLEENDKEKKPFDETLFTTTFSKENVEKFVNACKTATESEVNESNRLLKDDYIYMLMVTSHRAPHVPVHLSRILLPHSVETDESDICLFVKDLKRGRRLDYEPTIKHYETLLRNKKVDRNITIIPINQLYNDFATFELRRKLTYLYDRFLVDKAVATHVNGFLGHKLLLKCRSAIPIDIASDNLAEEIETSLKKVFYKHINNGITQSIQVGRHSMTDEQIGENIIDLLKQLGALHPGGSKNVYKIHLKPNVNISVAVPIYVDLAKPELDTPSEVGPKDKSLAEAGADGDDVMENFEISQSGEVLEKVRHQGSSIVGNNIVASDDDASPDDDDDMGDDDHDDKKTGNNKATAKKTVPAKKTGTKTVAKNDEAVISELILKNLKKLVGKDKLPSQGGGGGGSGSGGNSASKNIRNRPIRNRGADRNPRSGGGGGGGSNRSRLDNYGGGGGGGGRNSDFGGGRNSLSSNMGRGYGGGNSSFGGGNMNSSPWGNANTFNNDPWGNSRF